MLASIPVVFALFQPPVVDSPPPTADPKEEPAADPKEQPPSAENEEPPPSPLLPPKELHHLRTRPLGKGGAVWKPTSGIKVESDDGMFALTFRVRVQFRYELQHDHDSNQTANVFQIRRSRLQFKGHLFGKHNKYYLQIAISPNDMGWTADGPSFTPIRNWELSFDYLRDLTVTVGQMKVNYNRQRMISSGDLQLADRSNVNGEFTLDRDVGVKLHSEDLGGIGYLRYSLGIFNGEGRDGYRVQDMGMLYVARVEVIPTGDAGNWMFDEVGWERSLRPSFAIAGAYSFHDRAKKELGSRGSRPLDLGSTDFHQAHADLMFKYAGLSLTSEFNWRKGTREFGDGTVLDDLGVEVPAPHVPARNGIGYFVQAGFLIPRIPMEITGRWGQIIGVGHTSLPDSEEVGGGVSWYFLRHSLKLQADYFRLRADHFDVATLSFTPEPWSRSVDQFRVQMQVAF